MLTVVLRKYKLTSQVQLKQPIIEQLQRYKIEFRALLQAKKLQAAEDQITLRRQPLSQAQLLQIQEPTQLQQTWYAKLNQILEVL